MAPDLPLSLSVRTVLCLYFLIIPQFIFCQSSGATISGVVKDPTGKPVKYTSLSLLLTAGSTVVKSTTCNAVGSYRITGIKAVKYLPQASAIGFKNADKRIKINVIQSYQQDVMLTTEGKTLAYVKVILR